MTLTVRVCPRSSRPGLEGRGDEVIIRVSAPPQDGRATEEARRLLAFRLGVPARSVRLRSGGRSRVKVFEIEGLSPEDLDGRRRIIGEW